MSKANANRRQFIQGGSALATAAVLGGSLTARPAFAQSGPVRVTHFGGPYQVLDDLIGKPFETAGHGQVEYTASLTPATLGQLQANRAKPPFDIVMLSRPAGVRAGRAGLVQEIDKSKLPNLAQVQASSLSADNSGIPFILDTVEIMYNKTMVSEPITSWLDLWRPELKGKIALPSTSVVFAPDFVALIARALGGSEKDPEAVDAAFAKIIELKDNVRTFTTNPEQASTLMERNEIAATPQFGVRVSSVMRNNPDVTRAFTTEGVAARPYDLLIPSESPNKNGAYAYINFIIDKPSQEQLAAALWATPINAEVDLPAEVSAQINTDFDRLLFWDDTYMASVEKEWRTRWERTVQSG